MNAYPGLDVEIIHPPYDDPEIGAVLIDDETVLLDALGGEFDADVEDMLRASLLHRIAETGDRSAPEWLVAWLESKGWLDMALDVAYPPAPAMTEEEYRWLTNPSMM